MPTKYTREILEPVVASACSMAQVCKALGCKPSTGSQSYVASRVRAFGLDTSHFTGNGWARGLNLPRLTSDEVLVKGRKGSREKLPALRRSLKQMGVLLECAHCGQGPSWNGQPLVLQIDHENGDFLDNRIENLRYLCPNCHSQTDTFAGKKLRRPRGETADTPASNPGDESHEGSTPSEVIRRPRKFNPTAPELKEAIWQRSMLQVSKDYGVSEAAVRKRCKLLGVPTPPRGYWTKKNAVVA